MYQILIKNGNITDPENGLCKVADIVVADGKIAGIGDYQDAPAVMTVDAAGCLVTPGLIDHHAHVYPLAPIGIPAEAVCFGTGVTTVVDAGSTGCDTYRGYRPFLETGKLTVRAYLNVCSTGLDSLPRELEDVAPERMDTEAIKAIFEEYGSELLGLKLRTSKEIVGELGYEPLRRTVALAEEIGTSVMVHCTNPPGEMKELLGYLRKGDVITHMYMNKGDTILAADGQISEAALAARERGVLFEAADARAHFSFAVSEAAMREKFYPDIIATDLTKLSMHLRPTAFNLANQLGKYHFLGMPLTEVIACCTSSPAKQMGLQGTIGCLSVGANADIAVFRQIKDRAEFGDRPYDDPECCLRYGEYRFQPLMTVKDGAVVYREVTF